MSTNLEHAPLPAGEVSPEFLHDVTRQIAFSHGYDDALADGTDRRTIYAGTGFEPDYDRGHAAGGCDVCEAVGAVAATYLPISEPTPAVYVGAHRAQPERVLVRARKLLSLVGAR